MRSASVLRLSLKFSELKVCSSSTSLLVNSAASVAARNYSQFKPKSVRRNFVEIKCKGQHKQISDLKKSIRLDESLS